MSDAEERRGHVRSRSATSVARSSSRALDLRRSHPSHSGVPSVAAPTPVLTAAPSGSSHSSARPAIRRQRSSSLSQPQRRAALQRRPSQDEAPAPAKKRGFFARVGAMFGHASDDSPDVKAKHKARTRDASEHATRDADKTPDADGSDRRRRRSEKEREDKDREKDREKDRDKDREKDRERAKDKDREKEREKESKGARLRVPEKRGGRSGSERDVNPRTGKAKRRVNGITSAADLPSDILAKARDAKIPDALINDHLQDFLYVLRFATRDSFRTAALPHLPASDNRPSCNEELLRLAMESVRSPPKPLNKMFKRLKPEGKGGYGEVFSARVAGTKESVALKRVRHATKREMQSNYAEVAFLASCKHPNILKFEAAYAAEPEFLHIVTEYLEGGTLAAASEATQFAEQHIGFIAHEILQALAYLHARHFAHRDLKSSNIMMSVTAQIKLIDFGLCCDLGDAAGTRTQLLGSSFWIAPEMIKHEPHSTQADIWSFGICLLELYLGRIPWGQSHIDAMFRAVTGRTLDILPKCRGLGERGADFLRRVLVVDPAARADAATLLQHPFVSDAAANQEGLDFILRSIFVNRTLLMAGI